MHRIHVYVDGFDLEEVESELLRSFQQFAGGWNLGAIAVINDRSERTPDLGPNDLPTWNLGLNLVFEKIPKSAVEELLAFIRALSKRTGREFVIGDWDPVRNISEAWCFVGSTEDRSHVEFLLARYSGL
jgi:hypothetical protein